MLFHFITFQFEVGGEEHGTKTRAQGSSCRADNDLIEVGSDSGTATMTFASSNRPRKAIVAPLVTPRFKSGPDRRTLRRLSSTWQDAAIKLHLCQAGFVGDADCRHLCCT